MSEVWPDAAFLEAMRYRKKRTRQAPKASGADKCETKWCRNRRAAKITRYFSPATGKVIVYHVCLKVCWKCHTHKLRQRHPETYVLNALRGRAKQRGVPWTITLAEFRQWCRQTGYLELRGQEPDSMTIDRIDHDKGYHIWNIQLLSHAENSENGHVVPGRETKQNEPKPKVYDYDFDGPAPVYQPPTDPNCPF